jgi:hypothetical protein
MSEPTSTNPIHPLGVGEMVLRVPTHVRASSMIRIGAGIAAKVQIRYLIQTSSGGSGKRSAAIVSRKGIPTLD